VVFLLIGFEVSIPALLGYWKTIVAAFLAVLVGRAIVVFLVSGLLQRSTERIPWVWSFVLTWAGLRGAISMVLVLGLAANFPNRELLVHMTFGVVVLSILVQGTTMNMLLKRLGLVTGKAEYQDRYEELRGRLLSAQAALGELDEVTKARALPPDASESLRGDYLRTIDEAEASIQDLRLGQAQLTSEETLAARRRLLLAEKDALMHIFKKGVIGQDVYDRLVTDADARLHALDDDAAH
jgi:CPA1 family monovalent cation:H+ antiporter